jgi:predicted nucleic acid-binding protein
VALIHLDAGVVIGFLDRDDARHPVARAVLAEALSHGDRLAMAASAFAECLVGPSRRGEDAVRVVRELFDRMPISVIALDTEAAALAARLRSTHRSLRLPDALVIATAMRAQADQLVTTDRRWPTARALKLTTTIKHL